MRCQLIEILIDYPFVHVCLLMTFLTVIYMYVPSLIIYQSKLEAPGNPSFIDGYNHGNHVISLCHNH